MLFVIWHWINSVWLVLSFSTSIFLNTGSVGGWSLLSTCIGIYICQSMPCSTVARIGILPLLVFVVLCKPQSPVAVLVATFIFCCYCLLCHIFFLRLASLLKILMLPFYFSIGAWILRQKSAISCRYKSNLITLYSNNWKEFIEPRAQFHNREYYTTLWGRGLLQIN